MLLAPGFWNEFALYEDGSQREDLVELGADLTFLNGAEPGDFYDLQGRERVLVRLGRNWSEGEEGG